MSNAPAWETWAPPGTPAVHVWLCGRCSTELAADDHHCTNTCEVCGARYDTETGAYLGGSGRTDLPKEQT